MTDPKDPTSGAPDHVPPTTSASAAAPAPPDERKATVLRAVVAEHIATGQPVGSSHLTASQGLAVSPATVRNEMHQLERDGYLTHPHTSAGRIPTDRGYRFFVDSLGQAPQLSAPKLAVVGDFFRQAGQDLEQMLSDTSKLLADVTNYAAVVLAPAPLLATIRSLQLVGLGSAFIQGVETPLAVAVAVLSSGAVEKRTIDLPLGTTDNELSAATAHLSAGVGLTLSAFRESAVLRTGQRNVDDVCARVRAAFAAVTEQAASSTEVFVGGASHVVTAFDAVDTIRRVITALEEQVVVVNLLRETLSRMSTVSIGTEHGSDEVYNQLSACSVVVAPYSVDGHRAGTIGVIGPTRMNYPEAMGAVAEVADSLGNRLTDGPRRDRGGTPRTSEGPR